jgi:hypothetical protein
MLMMFCRWENGIETSLDAEDRREMVGFVKGLDAAARCLGKHVLVAEQIPNVTSIEASRWMSASSWLYMERESP